MALKSNGKKENRKSGIKIRKINEGAESIIYNENFLGINAVMKDRIVKSYREKNLDEFLRYWRTKKEAKIISIASQIINAPKVLFLEKYKILMQKIDGKNLNELLKKRDKTRNNQIDLNLILNEIGKSLAILHNNNIIHGDFTPANLIVNNNKVFVIDFGLSEISHLIEDKAIDLLLMKRAIDREKYDVFLNSYEKNAKESLLVIKRLEKIEKRGRYKERTLININ